MDPFPDLIRYPGLIYEVLISTKNVRILKNEDCPYNIAPMGITFKTKKEFVIEPYKTSRTWENLQNEENFGINFTHDASMFYKCVYEKENFVKEDFLMTSKSGIPTLNPEIYESIQVRLIAKKLQEIPTEGARAQFKCVLDTWEYPRWMFEPLCRANNLALEAIVHSTRIKIIKDPKKREKLLELINTNHEFIEKTARNSIYNEIMNKLKIKIKEF